MQHSLVSIRLGIASRLGIAVALLVPSAAAQLTSSQVLPTLAQGQMHGWAVGIQIQDATQASVPRELRVWGGGTTMPAPQPWTAVTFGAVNGDHPDFSEAALGVWATSRNSAPPAYNAMSTGGDICPPVDPNGVLQMAGAWYALSFTVAANAKGKNGSLVRAQSTGRNHAADVFTYYAEGGVGFHPVLNDSVRLEYSRAQLGLDPSPSPSIALAEINALDWGMGAISVDPSRLGGRFFPIRNRFYFTLSAAWITLYGGLFQGGTSPLPFVLNPGAVYCLTWQADSSAPSGFSWSDPVEVFSKATLFPGAEGTIEIDGLSVFEGLVQNSGTPWPQRIVLSLTPASDDSHPGSGAYSQVLVHQPFLPYMTNGVQALKSATGTLMTQEMGLEPRTETGEPNDVTGTCGVDPNELMLACGVAARSIYPAAVVREGTGNLGLSGYRTLLPDDMGNMRHRLFLTTTGTSFGTYPYGMVKYFLEFSTGSIELSAHLIVPGQLTCTYELPGDLPGVAGDVNVRAVLYGLQFTPGVSAVALRDSWHVTLRY
jgi:hypothetical protein